MGQPDDASARPVIGDSRWRLFTADGYLLATAGSDESWVVDDVDAGVIAELGACWTENPPTLDQLSRPAVLAVEQLRAVGVFGPPNPVSSRPSSGVVWSGDAVPEFAERLAELLDPDWPKLMINSDDADMIIVVRSNATMARTAEVGGRLLRADRIHLLCDLAAARTIAVGPFVVPGHTGCLGCLAGRIGHRWGDPPVPARPAVAGGSGAAVAAGLIAQQLRLATEDRFPLVDQTVSLDLDSLRTDRSSCLMLPQCPYCAGIRADRRDDGRVVLPWAP